MEERYKKLSILRIHSFFLEAFAPRGFLLAPTLKIAFEVCRSLFFVHVFVCLFACLFFLVFLHTTGLVFPLYLEEGDNREKKR